MKRKRGGLGLFMSLPLVVAGGVAGALAGFLLLILVGYLINPGNGQAGLAAIFVGAPLGALIGAGLGIRIARRM